MRVLCEVLSEEDADMAVELIDSAVALKAYVTLGDACTADESRGAVIATAGVYGAFLHSCSLFE